MKSGEFMNSTSILFILFLVGAYGLFILIMELKKYASNQSFCDDFLENLNKFWQSNGRDMETYGWLIHRSNKMQNQMGVYGIAHQYRPPYQNYVIKNYDIILNMIPELRKSLESDILSRSLSHQYMSALQESLVRYLGCIEDEHENKLRELKNPIKWFRNGVRDIIAVPAYLFGWLGVISESTANRFVSSLLFTAFSGIVAFAGFISAVVTIAVGWPTFIEIIKKIWS